MLILQPIIFMKVTMNFVVLVNNLSKKSYNKNQKVFNSTLNKPLKNFFKGLFSCFKYIGLLKCVIVVNYYDNLTLQSFYFADDFNKISIVC